MLAVAGHPIAASQPDGVRGANCDHRTDTVVKKEIYETIRVPRLWMVDPRYDNVEIYHSTEFGLVLKGILAGSEVLAEKLVPEFQFVIAELFATKPPSQVRG